MRIELEIADENVDDYIESLYPVHLDELDEEVKHKLILDSIFGVINNRIKDQINKKLVQQVQELNKEEVIARIDKNTIKIVASK